MVVGLERFADHFAAYKGRYVLIGGAAIWLILEDAGIEPRATKDLDIVLCVEALDSTFASAIWEFIRAGGYQIQEKGDGTRVSYRFQKPAQLDYPAMLEFFSRKPDIVVLHDDSHLTPIPVGEDVSSLSAILLDDTYYEFLHAHAREVGGVPIVGEECLIPLKARAWLDLTARRAAGERVDSKDIRKHRNDVLRLYLLLPTGVRFEVPRVVRRDMVAFLDQVQPELNAELLKRVGVRGVAPAEVIQALRSAYAISVGA